MTQQENLEKQNISQSFAAISPPGDCVSDGEEDARGGAAGAAYHELLLAELLWPLALHLEGAVEAGQHGGCRPLDVIVEHEVVAPVPKASEWRHLKGRMKIST